MANLHYTIRANQKGRLHQAAPGWCVAFVRFEEPCCGYSTTKSLLTTKPILVVENDCISMQVSNPKASFAKTLSITLKSGDVYYPNTVAPGDWVVAWMSDAQDDISRIVSILDQNRFAFQKSSAPSDPASANQLNNWNSGLKFVGRVIDVAAPETMQGPIRSITQKITCQAFLELASSVYFTYPATLGRFDTGNSTAADAGQQPYTNLLVGQVRFKGFAEKFFSFMQNSAMDPNKALTPDKVIEFLAILLLGMNSAQLGVATRVGPLAGNFNDAIRIPPAIAWLTGNPQATKLWEFYIMTFGLQQFDESLQKQAHASPWKIFSPIVDPNTSPNHNILFTTKPCKGWVLFKPPVWSNVSYWNIFSQYLNPTLNEMYTVLKVDAYNRIRPHFIVRERPFSTGLFQTFKYPTQSDVDKVQKSDTQNDQNALQKATQPPSNAQTGGKDNFVLKAVNPNTIKEPRTMYHNLPRWVIDESMIYAVDVSVKESERVNFVQVWGTNLGTAFAGNPNGNLNSPENYKITQFLLGNYVADDKDIARNGLRADISETAYDLPLTDGVQSHAPVWAHMMADWKFNGHLKPAGTITLYGVTAPIAEGDNCEVRGVVYHIDGVSHSGSLNGRNKTFRTTLSVSNGILAASLRHDKDIPRYPIQRSADPDTQPGPGYTDAEFTGRPDRNSDGERIRRQK